MKAVVMGGANSWDVGLARSASPGCAASARIRAEWHDAAAVARGGRWPTRTPVPLRGNVLPSAPVDFCEVDVLGTERLIQAALAAREPVRPRVRSWRSACVLARRRAVRAESLQKGRSFMS